MIAALHLSSHILNPQAPLFSPDPLVAGRSSIEVDGLQTPPPPTAAEKRQMSPEHFYRIPNALLQACPPAPVPPEALPQVYARNQWDLARLSNHNDEGFTKLALAASQGHTSIVADLLRRGAQVDELSEGCLTPLHGAVLGGHVETVKLLLTKGADRNARAIDGTTPLMLACSKSKPMMLNMVLLPGSDLWLRDQENKCAAVLAAEAGRRDLLTLLESGHLTPRELASPRSVDTSLSWMVEVWEQVLNENNWQESALA